MIFKWHNYSQKHPIIPWTFWGPAQDLKQSLLKSQELLRKNTRGQLTRARLRSLTRLRS